MKLNKLFATATLLFLFINSYSQLVSPFKIRYQSFVKGDIKLISNNITNRTDYGNTANVPYYNHSNSAKKNDEFEMNYIDIDDDMSTFSSSSSKLNLGNATNQKIVYAGLYWSATYKYESGTINKSGKYVSVDDSRSTFTNVKIKFPNQENYTDLTGEIIYDGFQQKDVQDFAPYVCYADITSFIKELNDPNGVYTVANVKATQGMLSGGVASGWTIFVVYEDPFMSGKFITSFDGFAGVSEKSTDILFNGFQTLPEGAITAKIACSALEGDNNLVGDQLLFNTQKDSEFIQLKNDSRSGNNFFNSSITIEDKYLTGRVPDSKNTLGYDTCLITIPNPKNSVIANNSTEATLRLKSSGDRYYMFFTAYSVEVVEPTASLVETASKIDVNKSKVDIKGNPITLKEKVFAVVEKPKETLNVNDEISSTVEREKIAQAVKVAKVSKEEEMLNPAIAKVEKKKEIVEKTTSKPVKIEKETNQIVVSETKKEVKPQVEKEIATTTASIENKKQEIVAKNTPISKVEKKTDVVVVNSESVEENRKNVLEAEKAERKKIETEKLLQAKETEQILITEATRVEVKKSIKSELKAEVKPDLKASIKSEVKASLEAEKENIKNDILKGLKEEILAELKTELAAEIKDEVKQEVKAEIKEEYKQKLKEQLKAELKRQILETENEVPKKQEEATQSLAVKTVKASKKEVVAQKPQIIEAKKATIVEETKEEETSVPEEKESIIYYIKSDQTQVGYYLIVNVFGSKANAAKFMAKLVNKGFKPKSFYNPEKNFTYIYIIKTESKEKALQLHDSKYNGRYTDDMWILGVTKE